jgi:outer membrane protein TolC
MRGLRGALLAGLLWLSVLPLPAQERVLDIDLAVRTALENNLALKIASLDLAGEERARRTAWNSLLPSLSARAGTSRGLLGPDAGDWSLSLGLQAGLNLAGDSVYQRRGAVLAYQRGLLDLETARRQLEREVRVAYYALLLAQSKIALIEGNIATSRQRYELARESYERGRASELEMLNARVALENLRPKLDDANFDYADKLLRFKQDLGLDLDTVISLTGTIETREGPLVPEDPIESFLAGRFDIRALVKEGEILENRRKQSALEEFAPTLSVAYSVTPGLADPWSGAWAGGDWETRSSLGVTFSLPLDPWLPASASRVQVRDLEDAIARNALALTEQRREAEIEIRSLVLEVENARRSLEVAGQNLALARRVFVLTEQEYNAGMSDFLTLQEADDGLREAQLALLTAGYDLRVGLLELEYALNTRLPGLEE